MKKETGIVIKAFRKHFGYKQEFLAQQINVTTETLANIENGRVGIDIEKLYRVSKVFNVPLSEVWFSWQQKFLKKAGMTGWQAP